MPKNHRSKSLKKPPAGGTLIEETEDGPNGYVQIFIKKEHLLELQAILTIHRNSTDSSQGEMVSLCGILSDCGILENKEN